MADERFLDCTVEDGMHDELAVTFESSEGRVSAFIPRAKVLSAEPSGQEVGGKLLVLLLDESETEGLIQLPAAPVNGSDVVKVPKRLLTASHP